MSKSTKTAGLWLTSATIARPMVDGCWRGFLGDPGRRNDTILHSVAISVAVGFFFVFPVVMRRLMPSPH